MVCASLMKQMLFFYVLVSADVVVNVCRFPASLGVRDLLLSPVYRWGPGHRDGLPKGTENFVA